MTILYAVEKEERLVYQSTDDEKALHVAGKTGGTFCRIYVFPGGELTTFNLEPKTAEESSEYINSLVAKINHIRELFLEARYDNANLIAQLKQRAQVVEKLKVALARSDKFSKTELESLIGEAHV